MAALWKKLKSLGRKISGRNDESPADDRRVCSEIFESMSILADGSVTCGCADIFEGRVLGNVNETPLDEIFHNQAYRELRRRMLSGELPPQCRECVVRVRAPGDVETLKAPELRWIQADPAFNCNLKCPDCAFTEMRQENYFIRPRTNLELETFKSVIEQAAPTLRHVRFHMLGEPFLNKRAAEMLAFAREKIPGLFISIETNGILLGPELRHVLIEEKVDYVKFSIDGATQRSYEKYRVGGDFQKAWENMAALVKERDQAGAGRPRVVWQYILFKWNDSDEEIRRAQKLAREAGVDELYWLITHSEGASERFGAGERRPILEGEGQSLNVTIDFAAREGRVLKRPAPTLEEYDPWK